MSCPLSRLDLRHFICNLYFNYNFSSSNKQQNKNTLSIKHNIHNRKNVQNMIVGEKGVIRRGRTMQPTLFHTNWKHLGSFHCCCHFVFLFRSYISYREGLDLTAVLCLLHLKVLWLFLIISPINSFQDKFFSLYFAICVIKPLN